MNFLKTQLLCRLVLAVSACVLLLVACIDRPTGPSQAAVARQVADSTARAQTDTTALTTLLHQYQKDSNRQGVMVTLYYLGRKLRQGNRFQEAIGRHTQEANMARQLADTAEMVRALNEIGTNYRRLGQLAKATYYHFEALTYCLDWSDTTQVGRDGYVRALNGLGNVYLTMDNYPMAYRYLSRALAVERQSGHLRGMAINYANIGCVMRDENHADSAWIYFRKSMEMNRRTGDVVGRALCHNYYGTMYEYEGDYDRATSEYEQAYLLLIRQNDRWHYLEPCVSLARIYMKRRMTATAMEYLQEALMTARELHSSDHLAQVYQLYYTVYQQSGNTAKALQSLTAYLQWNDSVKDQARLNEIQNIQLDKLRALNARRIADKRRDIDQMREQQHQGWLMFFLVLLGLVGLSVFFYYLLRIRTHSLEALNDLREARNNFFTNITHEFRTPLTIIRAASDSIEASTDDPAVRSDIASIHQAGGHLLTLVNKILDIAKLQYSSRQQPNWCHDDIISYIRMITSAYTSLAAQKKIRIHVVTKRAALEMDFVPDYVGKIVNNLMGNALKFGYEDSDLFVTIAVDKGRFRLDVKDHGVGIRQEHMKHIFEPFYESPDNAVNIGTGLGLALLNLAVKAMDGEVRVRSRHKEGTVFTVLLPLSHGVGALPKMAEQGSEAAAPVPDMVDDERLADGATAVPSTKPSILIVEDSPEVARYEAAQIGGSYRIYYAANGQEGLDKAVELVPDLIIADVMMPVMDGYALCEAIRANEALCHIPIIMVTAKVTQADRIRSIQAGADEYINKPFDTEELNTRIAQLLSQRRILRSKYTQAAEPMEVEPTDGESDEQVFISQFDTYVYDMVILQNSDLSEVAVKFGITRTQLTRKVKAITGMTSTAYIAQQRVKMARRLLETTDLTVSEVGQRCGIADTAYFIQLFKRSVGRTPGQYKEEWTRLR